MKTIKFSSKQKFLNWWKPNLRHIEQQKIVRCTVLCHKGRFCFHPFLYIQLHPLDHWRTKWRNFRLSICVMSPPSLHPKLYNPSTLSIDLIQWHTHTIDCLCNKMLNHGLNHGLFLSLFKLIPCPIYWIVYVLAYLNFIFEF